MSEEKSPVKGFTPGETAIICECFRNLTADPKGLSSMINFAAVATALGYKDAGIARTRFSQIKNKITGGGAGNGGVDKQSPTKKSPAKPRKAVDGAGEGTPGAEKGKKGRERKGAAKSVKKVEEEEAEGGVKEEEEGEGVVKEEEKDEGGVEVGSNAVADGV